MNILNEHGDTPRDLDPDPDVIDELDYWQALEEEENNTGLEKGPGR